MTNPSDLPAYCANVARRAAAAAGSVALLSGATKNSWLSRSAAALRRRERKIMDANLLDIEAALTYGLTEA